jgi:hypothetical protein
VGLGKQVGLEEPGKMVPTGKQVGLEEPGKMGKRGMRVRQILIAKEVLGIVLLLGMVCVIREPVDILMDLMETMGIMDKQEVLDK